jgi:hypothetical protein
MNAPRWWEVAIGWGTFVATLTAVILVADCAHGPSRAELAKRVGAYALELDRCVTGGHSYAEYEACAQIVDARYGVRP